MEGGGGEGFMSYAGAIHKGNHTDVLGSSHVGRLYVHSTVSFGLGVGLSVISKQCVKCTANICTHYFNLYFGNFGISFHDELYDRT